MFNACAIATLLSFLCVGNALKLQSQTSVLSSLYTNTPSFQKTFDSEKIMFGKIQSRTNTRLHKDMSVQAIASGQLFGVLPTLSWKLGSLIALFASLAVWIRHVLWTPSRTYENRDNVNSVSREYDAWTTEGILEEYWGEHIHLGYYNDNERSIGYKKKDFIVAKYDFIDEMMKFGGISVESKPMKVLDVGCGIGGTTRYLAKKFGTDTQVTGITISPEQQRRGTELAKEKGITNADFKVIDALNMTFPDNSFDIVWACESGEHMPDKARYINEMTRVLKPGGTIVVATWCERDEGNRPFTAADRQMLDFLYAEWTHPYFISINAYEKIMKATGKLENIITADWAKETIPSWWHSIWVGVYNPWPVIRRPHLWYKTFRDGITIDRMHQAFTAGLMQYGMMTAKKAPYKFEG